MKVSSKLLAMLVCFTVIITRSHSYRLIVDAVAEECFFDRVVAGTKISLIYEVVEGGFLDIDLLVTKPDGEELFSRKGESSAKLAFTASEDGIYTYCFSNRMSTVTPKEVKFSVDIFEKDKPISEFTEYNAKEVEEIQPEKLDAMIRELRSAVHGIWHEQEYFEVRDRIHRRIQESTNFRVTIWFLFEAILVSAVCIGQVIYIKRFFEVRRIV